MLNAGDLDRRITLQRPAKTKDSFNATVLAFDKVADVWASKEDVSDGERMRAAETSATITTRFRIRQSSTVNGIDATWRVVFAGRTYGLAAVKEIGRIDVPERPLQLLFGGSDGRTLFILTHHALFAVRT